MYDYKDQFQKIEASLLKGEKIYAVFNMMSGDAEFLGITDLRVIFFDKAFMWQMKAIVSIPYSRIHTVATEDGGFLGAGKMVLKTSGDAYKFQFASKDHKLHVAYNLILGFMVRPAH